MSHPGPWIVRRSDYTGEFYVERSFYFGFDQTSAVTQRDELNAQERVRDAAPDLLASLNEFVAAFVNSAHLLNDEEKEMLGRAQAAIKKATA